MATSPAAARALLLLLIAAGACGGCDRPPTDPMTQAVGPLVPDTRGASERLHEAISLEATAQLGRLAVGAVAYYNREHVSPSGQILAPRFPDSSRRTPAEIPCGQSVESRSAVWNGATWQALQFSTPEPHYFQYQFESSGAGGSARFIVWAIADLDCDGVLEYRTRRGEAGPGGTVRLE